MFMHRPKRGGGWGGCALFAVTAGGGEGGTFGGGCALFAVMAGGGGLGYAPFAVTAEPRPLSLFIFLVDE